MFGHESVRDCVYNPAVGCNDSTRRCEYCGWNPDVWAARSAWIDEGKEPRKKAKEASG